MKRGHAKVSPYKVYKFFIQLFVLVSCFFFVLDIFDHENKTVQVSLCEIFLMQVKNDRVCRPFSKFP